ncbi:phage terminase small subunit [Croceicoccus sp. YJ47]|uniref:phage terminase small subunit n=1 Tax=Croceicoccus sp. YJ47 TaxID=2798724 RepID=UPI00192320A1|nr:phage terminase small subunit [Croceicoccus sp. YJ47]QQN73183.1 terminase [Croceicoccus sp. YJ47]
MTSLAMRHRARTMAQKRAAPAAKAAPRRADRAESDYQIRLAELGEDLRGLKDMQSIEAKIARKAELLPKYDDWAEGVLAAAREAEDKGQMVQSDRILVQTMIWAIDTADEARALPRARCVLRHGMELPSRFERTLGCMIAEEFAETALRAMGSGADHIDTRPLLEIAELTEHEDMPDQARAKLHKAIAIATLRSADVAEAGERSGDGPAGGKKAALEFALRHAHRALALDDKSGVKKLIEQRTREANKLADANND